MIFLDLLDAVEEALTSLDVPINPTGDPPRALIATVSPGTVSNRRASGAAVNRTHTVTVVCAGTSKDETSWLAQQASERLDGLTIGSPHGCLEDVSYDGDPIPETDNQENAWTKTLTFTWTMKRGL